MRFNGGDFKNRFSSSKLEVTAPPCANPPSSKRGCSTSVANGFMVAKIHQARHVSPSYNFGDDISIRESGRRRRRGRGAVRYTVGPGRSSYALLQQRQTTPRALFGQWVTRYTPPPSFSWIMAHLAPSLTIRSRTYPFSFHLRWSNPRIKLFPKFFQYFITPSSNLSLLFPREIIVSTK